MSDIQLRRSKRSWTTKIEPVRYESEDKVAAASTTTIGKGRQSVLVSPEMKSPSKRRRKGSSSNLNDTRRPDLPVSSTCINVTTGKPKMGGLHIPEKIISTFSSSLSTSNRPTMDECELLVTELGKLHPQVLVKNEEIRASHRTGIYDDPSSCGFQPTVLDGVISTILSQNTTAANTDRAFANLKKAFDGGNWNLICKLQTPARIESAIRCAGLAKKRAQCIWDLCSTLKKERGEASLEYLRALSSTEVQEELIRFRGLGKKTISCVLLFTLGRPDFPVDTHVHRISMQNKWIPTTYSRDDAYEYLNAIVPEHLKLDLHCLLLQHGRECHRCAARGKPQFPPKDGSKLHCPLAQLNKVGTSHGKLQCDLLSGKLEGVTSADLVKMESKSSVTI